MSRLITGGESFSAKESARLEIFGSHQCRLGSGGKTSGLQGHSYGAQLERSAAAQIATVRVGMIEISRRQKAKSWELCATTSLARSLRDTNRRDEARAMLADIPRQRPARPRDQSCSDS